MRLELATAIAVAVAGVAAQSITSSPSTLTASPTYVTLTIDDCDTTSPPSLITVTNGVTVTYCPECMLASSSQAAQVTPFTTIWTTTYMSLCTTGTSHSMTPVVYTITESCTEPTPTWTPGPSYVPQGFTTSEVVCSKCSDTPVTYTVTEPCGCEETSAAGAPAPAAATPTSNPNPGSGSGSSGNSTPGSGSEAGGDSNPGSGSGSGSNGGGAPVSQISDGQIQAPTGNGAEPVTQISDGQVQAPTGNGAAPVSQISDGQVQAPTGTPVSQISDGQVQAPTEGAGRPEGTPTGGAYSNDTMPSGGSTTVPCPGPQCKLSTAASPSGSGAVATSPGTTSPAAYTGAAARLSKNSMVGIFGSALAVIVAGFAVLL